MALLEREAELAQLAAVIDAAIAGSGGVAVVEGPAGIGKTSLLRAAAEATDAEVLRATAGTLESDIPYEVVRSLFARRTGRSPAEEREALLTGPARAAGPLLGLTTDGAATDAASALHGLFWLTLELADRRPLVLVADDAHWADEPSLRFLAYLARRIDGTRVALLVGARTGEDRAALDDIRHSPATLTIAPRPLSAHAAARLAGDDVVAAAAGNPFLLTSGADGGAGLPVAVGRRLAELGPGAREVGEAVALLESAATSTAITELSGLEPGAVAERIDRLAAAGLIEPGPPVRAVHPLISEALLAHLGTAERAAAHGRAARALMRLAADPERVAGHLLMAAPAGDPDAVRWLRRAAAGAADNGAPEAAQRFLERALAEPPAPSERTEVRYELGTVLTRLGQEEGVAHLRAALDAAVDLDRRVNITRQVAQFATMSGTHVDLAGELLDSLTPEHAHHRVELLGGRAFARLQTSGPLDPDAFEELRGHAGDGRLVERFVASVVAQHVAMTGGPVAQVATMAALALGDEAAYARAVADGFPLTSAFAALGQVGLATAEHRARTEYADAVIRRRNSVLGRIALATTAAMVATCAGRVDDALDDATRALDFGTSGVRGLNAIAGALAARAHLRRGEIEAARGRLDAVTLGGWGVIGVNVAIARAELAAAEEDFEGARAQLEAIGAATGFSSANEAGWRSRLVPVLLRLGDEPTARRVATDDLAEARRSGAPLPLARALRNRALAGGGAGLEAALDAIGDADLPLERAQTRLALGSRLRREGERRQAREHLSAALDLADRVGAAVVAGRAREELLASGARPRRARRWGVDSLTPSELRVAQLAAQGQTNREIAADLFITPKTVEVHLSRCYRKLDLTGRDGLGSALGA